MRREITNNQLWLIENDISELPKTSPGVFFLNETKIKSFYDRNQMALKILHKRIHEIQLRYIFHDEENKPMKFPEVEGKAEWQFVESATSAKGELLTGEKVKEAYFADMEEFLNRSIKVEL